MRRKCEGRLSIGPRALAPLELDGVSTESLSEAEYVELADQELARLIDALDELEDEFEAELANGILTMELPGGPPFVLNSHRAARQLWLAADRSAWHFDYRAGEGQWVAEKTGDELWATLKTSIEKRLGRALPGLARSA